MVLIIVGASTIKSFGITLLIGILLSLVASLVLMRIILKCVLAFFGANDAKKFGLKRATVVEEDAQDATLDEQLAVEDAKAKGGAK